MTTGGGAGPGWYPDPRGGDGVRYWTGEAWAPDQASPPPPASAPAEVGAAGWSTPASYETEYLASHRGGFDPGFTSTEPMAQPPAAMSPWGRTTWLAVSAGVIAGFAAGFAVADSRADQRPTATASSAASAAAPAATAPPSRPAPVPSRAPFVETDEPPLQPPSPLPPEPRDRDAELLDRLGLLPTDVAPSVRVQLIQRGDRVSGETTLDLCDAFYPSEEDRTARRQLAAIDEQGLVMMTEAVLYKSAAALEAAFGELESAAASCNAKKGSARDWPAVQDVHTLAFDVPNTGTDVVNEGHTAVYMRRGRVLLAVYFRKPGVTRTPVVGHDTEKDVVAAYRQRLLDLPRPGTVA